MSRFEPDYSDRPGISAGLSRVLAVIMGVELIIVLVILLTS